MGEVLPANVPAIPVNFRFVRAGDAKQDARLVHVGEEDGVREVVATHTELIDERNPYVALLYVDAPLVEDGEYAIEMVACDATDPSEVARFTAGPPAELPGTLGVVGIAGPELAEMKLLAGGTYSCGNLVSGQFAEASVSLFPSVAAWGSLFQYSVTVDGAQAYDETWGSLGGSPPPGPGGIRLYRLCDESSVSMEHQGLAAGHHDVVFHAKLPGTTLELETAAVPLELYCEGEAPDGSAGEGGAMIYCGTHPPATDTDGGCGIATRGASSYSFLALGAALLAFVRRRAARRTDD